MPEQMVKPWVERLQALYPHLDTRVLVNNEIIEPNRIYIALGGKHCAIREGNKLRIRVTFSRDCKVVSARCLVLIKKLKEKVTIECTIPLLGEIHSIYN